MIFDVHPYLGYLGKMFNLTNIFQMGWNHQLDKEDCNTYLLDGGFKYIVYFRPDPWGDDPPLCSHCLDNM